MKMNKFGIILFLLPTLIMFGLIYAFPIVTVITTGFTDWSLFKSPTPKFCGVKNFITFFTDPTTLTAFVNTTIWIILQCTIHVAFGLLIALILAQKEFYWKAVRTIFMIPNMIPASALATVLLLVFHAKIGLINGMVRLFGAPDFAHNWFFSVKTAFLTVTLTWLLYAGVIVILLLTEIAAIPDALYESADIDGASKIQQHFNITLPLLRNVLGTCAILAATSRLVDIAMVQLTTNGGPGYLTMNLPLILYNTVGLENNYGLSNAIGTILILMGLLCVFLISKVFRIGKSEYL